MRGRALVCLLLVGCWLGRPQAVEARRDPGQDWRQLSTEHFLILYPAEASAAAGMEAAVAEEVYPKVKALCGYAPERTILVLNSRHDDANGLTQGIFPKIELYLAPPTDKWEGTLNRSWLEFVTTHEFTHMCYSTRAEGFTAILTHVFGEVNALNFIAPAWWVEGLAVYSETALTEGGRGRNPYIDMELAANLLSDHPWTLGQVSNPPAFSYPYDRYYIAGYFLVDGLAEAADRPDFLDRVSRQQSAWPFFGIGFAWKRSLKVRLGEVFRDVWEERKEAFAQRYGEERPPMAGAVRLTWDPRSRFSQPHWTQDGDLVGYCESDDFQPALVRLHLPDRQVVKLRDVGLLQGRLDYQAGTNRFYFGCLKPGLVYTEELTSDLFSWGPQGESRLTQAGRCWSPDVNPDGRLVAVQNRFRDNGLVLLDSSGRLAPIPGPVGATYYSPRWSPDGKRLAAAVRINGRQDICLVDPVTGGLTALTGWDAAGDFDPVWSPDGRYLFFVSDRSSVFQIYAMDLERKEFFQVTDSRMGAFDPDLSRDGKQIAFAEYFAGNHQQWVKADLDPRQWRKLDLPQPAAQPQAPVEFSQTPAVGTAYSAWPHMLPTYWMPDVVMDRLGPAWGIATSREDPLELHAWSLQALYQPDSGQTFGEFAYTNSDLPVILTADVFSMPLTRWGLAGDLQDTTEYWARKRGGTLQASLPLQLSLRSGGATELEFDAAYQAYRILQGDLPAYPDRNFQGLTASVIFQDTDQAPRDLFPVKGWELSGQEQAGLAGYDGRLFSWEAEGFIPSLAPHQALVLSFKTSCLAGSLPESSFGTAPRGWSGGEFNAGQVATLSAGYRFPVWYIDQGPGVFPIFFHDVWVECFGDWGAGWNNLPRSTEDWKQQAVYSEGLEVHADMQFLWSVPTALIATVAYRQDGNWYSNMGLAVGY